MNARTVAADAEYIGKGVWSLHVDGKGWGRLGWESVVSVVHLLSGGRVSDADWAYGILRRTCTWQEVTS